MTARILDGRAIAKTVRADVSREVAAFVAAHGRAPGLAVVLVGEDPASVIYTRTKDKTAREVGIDSRLLRLPASVEEAELLALIATLNADESVDGILVQLRLPKHLRDDVVLSSIDPDKDVDGLHPVNVGRLALGRPGLAPCTPLGCMRLLAEAAVDLVGARAVVVGASHIVGRPMSQLLLAADATVSIAHSLTRELPSLTREADVLVVAAGCPGLVRGAGVKEGAVVLDVGINRLGDGSIVGDVVFSEVAERASFLTPVPGGVGPMTIAFLLANTVRAANLRAAARRSCLAKRQARFFFGAVGQPARDQGADRR